MKKEEVVSGRYRSRIGEMFALEDEWEMRSLKASGILDSIENSLKTTDKVGSALYIGTSGDIEAIERAKKIFESGDQD